MPTINTFLHNQQLHGYYFKSILLATINELLIFLLIMLWIQLFLVILSLYLQYWKFLHVFGKYLSNNYVEI